MAASATRAVAQVNDHMQIIDLEMSGVRRVAAAYLVRAGRTCLIDSGPRSSSAHLVRALDAAGTFPDIVILTHSHDDHTQGVPALREEAARRGRPLTVMASMKALPYLRSEFWNGILQSNQTYDDIDDVAGLDDGGIVDLDGLELEVIDVAGHCADDIALIDHRAGSVFVGDALGYRIEHTLDIPAFMPPFWDPEGFSAAVQRIRETDYRTLCLGHFGVLGGAEARDFPDAMKATSDAWWDTFAAAEEAGRLDDISYVRDALARDGWLQPVDLELRSRSTRLLLRSVNAGRRVLGRTPIRVDEVQGELILSELRQGFRTYNGQ